MEIKSGQKVKVVWSGPGMECSLMVIEEVTEKEVRMRNGKIGIGVRPDSIRRLDQPWRDATLVYHSFNTRPY